MRSLIRFGLLVGLCLLVGAASAQSELPPLFQGAPPPVSTSSMTSDGIRLDLYFASLRPGGSGLLRLRGAGIVLASYVLRDEAGRFFRLDDGEWHALVALGMNERPGTYELTVTVQRVEDAVSFARDVPVEGAGFILQEFDLPADRAYLASVEVENDELEMLAALTAGASAEPLWDASGFELPLDAPLTSPFGSFRVLNGARQTRHTGWDQRAPRGSPVRAMAAGAVVFAGRLEIRGNYALIDHGLGIYSGYAHFADLLVAAGQTVAAGQIIGSSGNTGRSSGPHLHWEIAVDGKWVDGVAFLGLWLPA